MVSIILCPFDVPLASASARWAACRAVTLAGIGGSLASRVVKESSDSGVKPQQPAESVATERSWTSALDPEKGRGEDCLCCGGSVQNDNDRRTHATPVAQWL